MKRSVCWTSSPTTTALEKEVLLHTGSEQEQLHAVVPCLVSNDGKAYPDHPCIPSRDNRASLPVKVTNGSFGLMPEKQ